MGHDKRRGYKSDSLLQQGFFNGGVDRICIVSRSRRQESLGVRNICETKRKTNYYEVIINN